MIYQLPTRSTRKYTGHYPERVHSLSLGRVTHVELNNGRRFVALHTDLAGLPRLGMHVSKVFKPVGIIPMLSVPDYAGIMLITRLCRALRFNAHPSKRINLVSDER